MIELVHDNCRFETQAGQLANPQPVGQLIHDAYDHLLTAETSCNFYWGSQWVHQSFDELEITYRLLDEAVAAIPQKEPT